MALRGPLLEKAILLGIPAAALATVLAASYLVKGMNSRPPEVVFEGQVSLRGSGAPVTPGAVARAVDTTPPTVTGSTPAPGTTADTDFTEIEITFSERIDPASLNPSTVLVERSGGDGNFSDGNEVQITPDSIELIDGTHARVVLPSGQQADTYRVYLLGNASFDPTSATSTSSTSGFSTTTTTSSTSSTSTGQVSTATTSTSTSNSTSATSNSSSTSNSTSSSTSTATSGATSSATTSTSTTSASSNSTTSATSNSTSASTTSATSTTSTGGCADSGFVTPLAGGSSSGSGYFGG